MLSAEDLGNKDGQKCPNRWKSGVGKKPKAKRKQQKKWCLEGKKGSWQTEDGDDGNESDHYCFCDKCKDGGLLFLCDTCPRSYHAACLKPPDIPEGDWSCPTCEGEELPSSSESEDEFHDSLCNVCQDVGKVLLCDFCTCVYHPHCLNPPLVDIPPGAWKCPRCLVLDKPLKAKVKEILTWRWSQQLDDKDDSDHPPSTVNETLKVFQPILHTYFKRKWDLDEPPAVEDGSSFGQIRRRPHGGQNIEDPFNLEEQYYRYGVKPEWLQVHRIINHDGRGKDRSYLVRWRDLPCDEATWEDPDHLPKALLDWEKHLKAYWARRKENLYGQPLEKSLKRSALKEKLIVQPEFISKTGGQLHDYQLEGLNWLRFSWAQKTNTILADEMGLGKTIQAIVFIYELWKKGYLKGPFMISAPLSTLPNWEREFEFWAPELYVVNYCGGKHTRMNLRKNEFSFKEGAFSSWSKASKLRAGHKVKFDVLLTSYQIPSIDFTTLQSIRWDILVVDEAHRLKRNQSLYFRTMSRYKVGYKLLLTGTPLQNNLEELFNLLNFMQPKKFNDIDTFLDEFEDISKDEQIIKLHQMLAPHMLRRIKCDVLKDIPPKNEFIVRVELSEMQKKFYKHILTKNFRALNVRGHMNQTSLQWIVMDLRKCCNHPYLFPAAETEAPMSRNGGYEGTALIKACGKLKLLSKMLKVCKRDNHRVLIFSQMTRVLDILEDFLLNEGYGYERIDGGITGSLRQTAIDRFNSEESRSMVFLLSTRAGGLGINLATADTVIIYDMDWNPHNDIQALSRAHRIGQKKKVMIYRFVSHNTIEERMTQVCKKKMMLTELIIHQGMGGSQKQGNAEILGKKELSEILKFGAENLFKEDAGGTVVYDDAAVEKLMDRSHEGEEVAKDDQTKVGMNEYLRSFKVASYQVEEGEACGEEEENNNVEENKKIPQPAENDSMFWKRVIGDSYQEHYTETLQESLGKGKRVRKQVNYYAKVTDGVVRSQKSASKKENKSEVMPDFQDDVDDTCDDDDDDENKDPNFCYVEAKNQEGDHPNKKRKLTPMQPSAKVAPQLAAVQKIETPKLPSIPPRPLTDVEYEEIFSAVLGSMDMKL